MPLSFPDVNVPKVQPALIERAAQALPEETPRSGGRGGSKWRAHARREAGKGQQRSGQRPNQDKPLEP